MDINNFSSYFEIFAALNLAYAGSEVFRQAVDEEVFFIRHAITPTLQDKMSQLHTEIQSIITGSHGAKVQSKVNNIAKNFNKISQKIEEDELRFIEFTAGFKSMFLIIALYCLSVLLLSGYAQFFQDDKTSNVMLSILNIVIFFNLFVFGRSFVRGSFDKEIKSPIVILIFLLIMIGGIVFINFSPVFEDPTTRYLEATINITFAVIIAASPFLLHFLRVFVHKYIFRLRILSLVRLTNIRLSKIEEWVKFPSTSSFSVGNRRKVDSKISIYFKSFFKWE